LDRVLTELAEAELAERARGLRLVLTDVDGVLTDGGVYYSAEGEALKRFHLRDGMGVELLRHAGIETGFVTRESSPIVQRRAEKLKLVHAHLGVVDKRRHLEDWLAREQISPGSVAYIGDDVNDLETMLWLRERGVTAAPADGVPEVRRAVHLVTHARGGHGAFREFADFLIRARTPEETK
jgi:3-deoxy-D-manno-octulosonate 8-phosphate phosphatase (KDO 8-P phosphatase)